MIKLEQAKRLIKLARESISCYFSDKEVDVYKVNGIKVLSPIPRAKPEDSKYPSGIKEEFSDILGVFVTLNKDGELRGCIGFPEPVYPLYEGVIKAAQSAAFSDPRFPSVNEEELKDISIEISVLTKPEQIKVKKALEYVDKVKVGRDGLIIKGIGGSGLLLPQVATEYKWDSKTFLSQTCVKAGLSPDSWQDIKGVSVFRFESQVFSEIRPNGEVKQIM